MPQRDTTQPRAQRSPRHNAAQRRSDATRLKAQGTPRLKAQHGSPLIRSMARRGTTRLKAQRGSRPNAAHNAAWQNAAHCDNAAPGTTRFKAHCNPRQNASRTMLLAAPHGQQVVCLSSPGQRPDGVSSSSKNDRNPRSCRRCIVVVTPHLCPVLSQFCFTAYCLRCI